MREECSLVMYCFVGVACWRGEFARCVWSEVGATAVCERGGDGAARGVVDGGSRRRTVALQGRLFELCESLLRGLGVVFGHFELVLEGVGSHSGGGEARAH